VNFGHGKADQIGVNEISLKLTCTYTYTYVYIYMYIYMHTSQVEHIHIYTYKNHAQDAPTVLLRDILAMVKQFEQEKMEEELLHKGSISEKDTALREAQVKEGMCMCVCIFILFMYTD
jgi:hypothetical protein